MIKNILITLLIMFSVWFMATLAVTLLQIIWALLPFTKMKSKSFIDRFLDNSAWVPNLFLYILP
ncbi:hypothetical protein ACNAN0_11905 [Agrilactobacillus fermenti]|uniref:hypothetical protein n=1 Tax=Agrilactobacillus fermenti TaxID=2586909 RepID=UPI003A5C672A